jgi:hypothetical protein
MANAPSNTLVLAGTGKTGSRVVFGAEPVFAFLAPEIKWEVRPDLPDAGI